MYIYTGRHRDKEAESERVTLKQKIWVTHLVNSNLMADLDKNTKYYSF